MAVILVFSFNGSIAAQQNVKLKEIKLEALGQTVLTKNEAPTKVTAIFSDGTTKNVTRSQDLEWDTGSGENTNKFIKKNGLVYFGDTDDRSVTIWAIYTFDGKKYKSNTLVFKIHDDYTIVPGFPRGWPPEINMDWLNTRDLQGVVKVATMDLLMRTSTSTLDPGDKVHQTPERGKMVKKKTTVTIYVMPERVPDLIGKTKEEATKLLHAKGYELVEKPATLSVMDVPPGTVRIQSPPALTPLDKGSKVTVRINAQPIVVPDVIGKTEAEAKKTLVGLGLSVEVGPSALHDPNHDVGKIVDQSPDKGKEVVSGAKIRLGLNPAPLPRMGIKVMRKVDGRNEVQPLSRTFLPGVELFFREDLDRDQGLQIDYIWYIDGRQVDTGKVTKEHMFRQSGVHYVQLVAKCAALGWEDAIIRNIHIEYPPEPELGIWVNPSGPYIPGQRITLEQNCINLPGHPTYNWSVGYNLPDEKGTYAFTLGLRFGSDNFDSLKKTITITVGDPPIGLMGTHVNRFRVDGVPDNVRISSSYWKGGYTTAKVTVAPGWSDFVRFRNVGAVAALDFYTGLQADGHNTGFLVYVPAGRNRIHFAVCGFRFGDPYKTLGAWKGYVRYSRDIPVGHGHTVIPQTLRWVEEHARCGVAEWQTEQGTICRARIWKTKSSGPGTITQKIFIKGGLEDLGCEQYDPSTDPGTGTTAAGIATATQAGGQFQAGLGQPPGGGVGSGNLSNVTVSQNDITVTFWDHGKEDGDIINIYLNGKLFKGNVRLTNKKKKFQVKLNSGNNTFEVEAVNEGSIPPNTASVRISHVTLGRASQIYEKKSGKRASMNLSAP
jgi:hypothetical protein